MIRPVPESVISIRTMRHEDLAHVSDIERRSYDFPWSHGVFRDCLLAGYGFATHVFIIKLQMDELVDEANC